MKRPDPRLPTIEDVIAELLWAESCGKIGRTMGDPAVLSIQIATAFVRDHPGQFRQWYENHLPPIDLFASS